MAEGITVLLLIGGGMFCSHFPAIQIMGKKAEIITSKGSKTLSLKPAATSSESKSFFPETAQATTGVCHTSRQDKAKVYKILAAEDIRERLPIMSGAVPEIKSAALCLETGILISPRGASR
jgi:hypothetical protein